MRFGFRDGAGDERACRDELLARKAGKRSREQKHQQSRELVPHGNLQGSSCSYVADDDGLLGVRRSTTLSGEMVTKRAQRYQVGSFASQNETVILSLYSFHSYRRELSTSVERSVAFLYGCLGAADYPRACGALCGGP